MSVTLPHHRCGQGSAVDYASPWGMGRMCCYWRCRVCFSHACRSTAPDCGRPWLGPGCPPVPFNLDGEGEAVLNLYAGCLRPGPGKPVPEGDLRYRQRLYVLRTFAAARRRTARGSPVVDSARRSVPAIVTEAHDDRVKSGKGWIGPRPIHPYAFLRFMRGRVGDGPGVPCRREGRASLARQPPRLPGWPP